MTTAAHLQELEAIENADLDPTMRAMRQILVSFKMFVHEVGLCDDCVAKVESELPVFEGTET